MRLVLTYRRLPKPRGGRRFPLEAKIELRFRSPVEYEELAFDWRQTRLPAALCCGSPATQRSTASCVRIDSDTLPIRPLPERLQFATFGLSVEPELKKVLLYQKLYGTAFGEEPGRNVRLFGGLLIQPLQRMTESLTQAESFRLSLMMPVEACTVSFTVYGARSEDQDLAVTALRSLFRRMTQAVEDWWRHLGRPVSVDQQEVSLSESADINESAARAAALPIAAGRRRIVTE